MFVDSKISRIFASLLRNNARNDVSGCSAVRLAHLLWEQGSQVRILVSRQKRDYNDVVPFLCVYILVQ